MMDHQIKTMIVDALMKVVDSAPINSQNPYKRYFLNQPYIQENPYQKLIANQLTVSKSSFDTWKDYALSVLGITEQYINAYLYTTVVNQIQNVVLRTDTDYTEKTTEICRILLELAKRVLYL